MANLRDDAPPVFWLEAELARELSPVAAPDALWRRIHDQQRPLRVMAQPWLSQTGRAQTWRTWALASALTIMLLAGLAWRSGATGDPSADLEALAEQELRGLASGVEDVDIHSDNPAVLADWVKRKTGADISLSGLSGAHRQIRLIGARLIPAGRLTVAALEYRVGDDFAAMLVTNRSAGPGRAGHASSRAKSDGGVALYSWKQGRNDFAIAFSSARQPQRSCLLCHATMPAAILFR